MALVINTSKGWGLGENKKKGKKNNASTVGTNDKHIGAEVNKRETTRCEQKIRYYRA